jgi:hypothetical protein
MLIEQESATSGHVATLWRLDLPHRGRIFLGRVHAFPVWVDVFLNREDYGLMRHALPSRDNLAQLTAAAVRVEMARQDISPAAMAAALGVELRVLNRRLKCRSAWTLDWLEAVSAVLQVEPRQLISGETCIAAA